MHAGHGVHRALNQSLELCTIPIPLALNAASQKLAKCSINHASSVLEVSSGGPMSLNIHFSCYVRHGVTSSSSIAIEARSPRHSKKTVLRLLAPFSVHFTTICCASVHMHIDAHISGFLAHPAIVDSCLHIGALVATHNALSSSSSVYIPVAFKAFVVFGPLQLAPSLHAHAKMDANNRTRSALSSYFMRQDENITPCGFQLSDLHAHQLHPERPLGQQSASQFMPIDYTYTIQWQLISPLRPSLEKERLRHGSRHSWLDNHGNPVFGKTTYEYQSVAASFLMNIALIQSLIALAFSEKKIYMMSDASPLHSTILPLERLQPLHHLHNESNAHVVRYSNAASLGIVKVAASEHPEHVWGALLASPLGCEWPTISKDVDAFGQSTFGKGILSPRMLVASHRPAKALTHCNASAGKAIISGGLNGVRSFRIARRR